jgi:hypothetical protein
VTPEEAAFWQDREDIPQLMRDAINAIPDGARRNKQRHPEFPGISLEHDVSKKSLRSLRH